MDREMSAHSRNSGQVAVQGHSTIYELYVLVLTIFSLVLVAGLLVWPTNSATRAILMRVDFVLTLLFLVDFGVNIWRAPNKAVYFIKRGGWLDLLGCIPVVPGMPWTALFRLARLARLIRIVIDLRARERGEVLAEAREVPARTVLLSTVAIGIMLVTIASLFVLRLEREAPGATIKTGADAIWWALVTITTVGYGDYVPVTFFGRILAMILMTFGIGIFAVLTGFAGTRLVGLGYDQEAMIRLISEENAIIRAELAELKDLVRRQGAMDDAEV